MNKFLMIFFYFFACLVVWQSFVSLIGGVRYLAYVRGEMGRGRANYNPFASIIVPCRGLDSSLRENLGALFVQDYPAYEIVFVLDRADDEARVVIEEARGSFENRLVRSRVVVAGQAEACGQKVHNLRVAVGEVDEASEVLVFVDTDARPQAGWLASLVAPLEDERIGATTGYRWFVSVRGSLASHLRSIWNASIASALGSGKNNFCWGGSTAIRRATFLQLDMMNRWRGALSDDFALTAALREAELLIHFVPNCLSVTHEDCTFAELLEFTTRQIKITRVYATALWHIVMWSNLIFVSVFFGALALGAVRAWLGLPYLAPLLFVATIFCLGAAKAGIRLYAVRLPLAAHRNELRRSAVWHLTLFPFTAALYLYNAIAALVSRRITWRGITYEMKSPTETAIIPAVPFTVSAETKRTRHA